jgi:hypothetical protein
MQVIYPRPPAPIVTVHTTLAVSVPTAQPTPLSFVNRGPVGPSGNAVSISADSGNGAILGTDGGIFVEVNPLSSFQW